MSNGIGFAALSLQITTKKEFRIIPAGRFKGVDGRPAGGSWVMTASNGAKLIEAAQSRQIDYVIDYEHQTMLAGTNGKPAPAAGWFKKIAWRDDGLYVVDARWTSAAKAMIDSEQYRFISPTFLYDSATLQVNGLHSVALTNNPNLHDLTDLSMMKLEHSAGADGRPLADLTARDRENLERVFGVAPETLHADVMADKADFFAAGMTAQERQNFERVFGKSPVDGFLNPD